MDSLKLTLEGLMELFNLFRKKLQIFLVRADQPLQNICKIFYRMVNWTGIQFVGNSDKLQQTTKQGVGGGDGE